MEHLTFLTTSAAFKSALCATLNHTPLLLLKIGSVVSADNLCLEFGISTCQLLKPPSEPFEDAEVEEVSA